jgi:arginyl-tRNA synthetase
MFREEVVKLLQKATKLSNKEVDSLLEIPPDSKLGDLTFPCFVLAKKLKKNPKEIAESIKKGVKVGGWISSVRCVGPYLNFFVNSEKLAEEVLKRIWKEKVCYGTLPAKKKVAVVEYCQANTHKAFHIGHLRNISLGESVARRISYGGDIGPHVAKCLWAYLKYHKKHNVGKEKYKGSWLGKLYAEGAGKYTESAKVRNEVTDLTADLYEGKDKALMKVWKETKKWSIDEFKEIFKELGIKFDDLIWESEVSDRGLEIAKDVLKKKVAEKSEGATVVNLEKYGLGVWVLLTSEGYPLYSSKELALAELKFKKYKDIDLSIHVVASEQNLHFKQLFKTLELIGFKRYLKKSHHLSYELVTLKSGKMASRAGEVITYRDLAEKAKEKTLKEVVKRNPKLSKKKAKEIGDKVGVGALKFAMVKQAPNKVIKFDWDEALAFDGDSGPYLQYTLVRANRILEKADVKPRINVNFKVLKGLQEVALVKELAKFPSVLEDAARKQAPYLIAYYTLELASKFSSFYEAIPLIIKSSKEEKEARLLVVWCFTQVLRNCLHLLGMEEVDRM